MKSWDIIDEQAYREAYAIQRLNRLAIKPRTNENRMTHKICEIASLGKRKG
jgi:hypothetical protein